MNFRKFLLFLAFTTTLFAKNEASTVVQSSQIDSGDTAWILISAPLVLLMTVPGIALFYAGMVRKKNILALMMKNFVVAGIVSVTWVAFGYSIAFTSGNALSGGFDMVFLHDLFVSNEKVSVHENANTIPEALFVFFQMTFAVISAAIITGAFAERMKFSAFCLFIALWSLLVYAPSAHWVWQSTGWLAGHGELDYAGGTVVHINAGIAGLVGALMLGKRVGYKKEAMPPYNLVLTLVGVALLWFGWFGFNAGSAVAGDGRAAMAMLTTQIATAVAALVWLGMELLHRTLPSALGFASGAVCGLVGITPAAGFVGVGGAIAIGVITPVICFYMVTIVKNKLGYDDSLDAFGIHGVGGIVGSVLTAVFCNETISAASGSVSTQLLGIGVAVLYSGLLSFVLLKIIDKILGLRVDISQERVGLDIVCHGQRLG
ncbi:MAG: ammonium transporter [Campylobacter sp.]|nr:ammonium transporter [Campylobacter sp.]